MKNIKRITAILMTLILLISCVSAGFSALAADGSEVSYRSSQAYQELVSAVKEKMKNRETHIEVSTYLPYRSADEREAISDILFDDVYQEDKAGTLDPFGGDYLYHSVRSYSDFGKHFNSTAIDMVTFDVTYYDTPEMEAAVKQFILFFMRTYLSDFTANGAENMSDVERYYCVKTIYDFIVRNTEYDNEVRRDERDAVEHPESYQRKYAMDSDRYMTAHSAYGALYGNLKNEGEEIVYPGAFREETKKAITGQPVPVYTLQGLAVCEGISKLFYVLCESIGIPCYLVDGDYTDGSGSDPHEWIYVYLNDGVKEDGYRWYQIDATYAGTSIKTLRNIDINDYDFFLRGTANPNFSVKEHPQPYLPGAVNPAVTPIYDFTDMASVEDYEFPIVDFTGVAPEFPIPGDPSQPEEQADPGVILERFGDYTETTPERIYYVGDKFYFIGASNQISPVPLDGFTYVYGETTVRLNAIPYLIDGEYECEPITGSFDVGEYKIYVKGANKSSVPVTFKIIPYDMSNENQTNYTVDANTDMPTSYPYMYQSEADYDYEFRHVYKTDGDPKLVYTLIEGKDYDFKVIPLDGQSDKLTEIGRYELRADFKGNYCGSYSFSFEITKAELDKYLNDYDDDNTIDMYYTPKAFRTAGQTKAIDYYKPNREIPGLTEGVDYVLDSEGGIEYGNTGKFIVKAKSGSAMVKEGTQKEWNYKVNQAYNIKNINDAGVTIGDSSTHEYTGSGITPSSLSYLDEVIPGQYEIVGYSDNVNVTQNAKVTVRGKNGCTGNATFTFQINPTSIVGNANVKCNFDYNRTTYQPYCSSVTFKGRLLTKGTDYTENVTETPISGGMVKRTVTIHGIGNFNGYQNYNLEVPAGTGGSGGSGNSGSSGSSGTSGTSGSSGRSGGSGSFSGDGMVYTLISKSASGKKTTVASYIMHSNNSKTYTYIHPVTLKSAKGKKKSVTVKWTKLNPQIITGYAIEYSLKKNFKGAKVKYVKGSKASLTIKKLKSKKNYYIRIRAYITDGGKTYYSAYSKTKKVKVK